MNRLEIRNLSRKKLGETTAAFWSDDEINAWINDGCRDIAYRTKCLRTNTLITPTNAVSEYVLSTVLPKVTSITEVYFKDASDEWSKLEATSRTELDETMPGWMGADSVDDPTHYWWDREDDIFYIYPSITTAEANSIRVFYTIEPTDLVADADSPELPEMTHLAIVDFVVATRGNH